MDEKIKIELPSYKSMEEIRVRLDKPRIIEYKDGRKSNVSRMTFIPIKLNNYDKKAGIYIICKNEEVKYVGMTSNLNKRMRIHSYLNKNSDIKFVFFLEEQDKNKRLTFEIFYKYYYFRKVKFEKYHN